MFRCGSFSPEEDDPWAPSSPRKSRRKQITNNNKNPYSARGLDKFAIVLAELEEKRQKIMERMGSSDVALVRFVYSNSHEWVPIVVKPRDQKQAKPKAVDTETRAAATVTSAADSLAKSSEPERKKLMKKFSWGANKVDCGVWWRSPSYYWSIILILILLCLVIFGRAFAILCTTTLWYAVPMINGVDSNGRRSMKKKDYTRKLSEKKMVVDRLSEVNLRKRG